jgi:hypothetical protein
MMIHVAPCSCELHVKIRELEAELADALDNNRDERADFEKATVEYLASLNDSKARAEKAEATLKEKEKIAIGVEWFQRMTDAKVRVAELEAEHECHVKDTELVRIQHARILELEKALVATTTGKAKLAAIGFFERQHTHATAVRTLGCPVCARELRGPQYCSEHETYCYPPSSTCDFGREPEEV